MEEFFVVKNRILILFKRNGNEGFNRIIDRKIRNITNIKK
jgi:hypothetical protein